MVTGTLARDDRNGPMRLCNLSQRRWPQTGAGSMAKSLGPAACRSLIVMAGISRTSIFLTASAELKAPSSTEAEKLASEFAASFLGLGYFFDSGYLLLRTPSLREALSFI